MDGWRKFLEESVESLIKIGILEFGDLNSQKIKPFIVTKFTAILTIKIQFI